MSAISNFYLIIFLPLISSILCQLFSKKSLPFAIAFFSSFALLLLLIKTLLDLLIYKNLGNDFNISEIALALEFSINSTGITFLLLVILIKVISLFNFKSEIEELLTDENNKNFYAVFLLNIFSLIGIFSSNNLLNLFIFLEIYSFTFFATLAIANNKEISQSTFKYFCFSAASSLLILFCFLAIYLTLGDLEFDKISQNLQLISNQGFVKILFSLLLLAFLMKFLPFGFFIKKIEKSDVTSGFFLADSLFVKLNIAIFLFLKFTFFFFGNLEFTSLLTFKNLAVLVSLALVSYSSFRIFNQRNLSAISIYFCLNNLGFIIASIALKTTESFQALFFYILNFSLVNFAIFIIASFLNRNFGNVEIDQIAALKQKYFKLALPFKLLLVFLVSFPLTILFFANWYLAYAALEFDFEIFLLLALVISNLAQINFATKVIHILRFSDLEQEFMEESSTYGFLSIWLLVAILYASIFALAVTGKLSLNFATGLLG